MSRRETLDLTQGNIWKKLILFILPILASSIFQQLYNTMDAIIVGQITGKLGLAAVNAVSAMMQLPVNFFNGMAAGATILISQYFGSGQYGKLHEAEHTAAAFSLLFGVFLSIFGVLITPSVLHLMEVPDEIYPLTLSYTSIYFAGLVFSLVYNIGAAILRAVGNTRIPFRILVIAGIINIVLDLLFVGPLHWNVAGAAIATVIAQAVSAFLVIRALVLSNDVFHLNLKEARIHRAPLKKILSLGLPTAFQNSVWPAANLFIQSAMNGMGTDYIAAWGLQGKLELILWLCMDSFGPAMATFVAQNYGAGKYDRVKEGVRDALVIGLALDIFLSLIIYFFNGPLSHLFISADSYDILPLTAEFSHFLAPFYWTYVFCDVLSGSIQGTGETVAPMVISILFTAVYRIIWIFFYLPFHYSPMTIAAAYPISWIMTGIVYILYYIPFSRKKLSQPSADKGK